MNIIYNKTCQFSDLDFGDVFRLKEYGAFFMKAYNKSDTSLNCVDIRNGEMCNLNPLSNVVPIKGSFVEDEVLTYETIIL